jgi:hypothetical protein
MKVLVFTSSYKRPYMLRSCMLNVKNQTYSNIKHLINITNDIDDLHVYLDVIDDVFNSRTMRICHSVNNHTHFNNMTAIKQLKTHEDYDLFIKMDDDDIYKADYVQTIVDAFKADPTIDIVSSKISHQLNGNKLMYNSERYDNLGGNPGESTYHMPMTFAFNKKAFDVIKNLTHADIIGHDDMMWRIQWEAHGLKHVAVQNDDNVIWHVHGKNVSTAEFLEKPKQTILKRLLNWLGL